MMASTEIIQVKTTGGQVDEITMALIDTAYDKDPKVRENISASLLELGKKQPELLLTSCLVYLHKHAKLSQGHKIQIFIVMESIVKHDTGDLHLEVALQVIKHVSSNMTASKDVIPDLQNAASAVLVALGRRYCNHVMEDLLVKFQPGILPHFFVVETLGNLATANVFGMLPFLKGALGTMLPMLGLAKGDNMKWVFATALAKFCEAILDYVANIEKAPDPEVRREAFNTEINNAFDVLLNVWISSREAKLRVAVVEALGQMSHVMSHDKLQEQISKVVSSMLALYRKHQEPYHITQGLCMVLDAATQGGSTMLEPHFDQLNSALFPQVCQAVDYTQPMTIKNHNEVLRCYAVLARSFSDRLVSFCILKLESTNEKYRIGVLGVLRHLINSAVPHMEDKKSLVLAGLKILLNDSSNKVKKVLAQTIIAMGHHSYLELEGGQLMVEFIIKQCALTPEPTGRRPNDPDYVSNEALRSMCDNVLQLLSTTVDGIDRVLWPYILEFLVIPEYTTSINVLCQSISHIAGKKRDEAAIDLEIRFDKLTNLPRPQAIFARLIVLAGWPSQGKNRGIPVLQALKQLGPVLNEYIGSLWDTVIPKLVLHLEESMNGDEEWNQKIWEDLILKFLSKSLDQISEEEWIGSLAESLGAQIPLYTDHPEDKNFLYKCLGLTLKKLTRKDIVNKQMDLIFQSVKHSSQIEREGCAIAIGFIAASHLDSVLTKLELVGKLDTSKKSSGLFSFIKDSVNIRSDLDEKTRATAMLCYGYVTMYAPCDLIVSRLEAVIARVILPQFELVKDAQMKCNLILAVDLIAKAMHPGHLGQNHPFSLRSRLLQHMQTFIKAEKSSQLTSDVRALAMSAAANLVKLDPVLSDDEIHELINTALDSVMALPPGGATSKSIKEESYQEHIESERLIKSTQRALQELLTQAILKELTPAGLERIINLLQPWSCTIPNHERERSVHLMYVLLGVHLEHVDPVQAGSSFSSLGRILGWLVPRCSDPCLPISHQSIDSVQMLLRIAAKYEVRESYEYNDRPTLSPVYCSGQENRDTLIDALPTLKDRLTNTDSTNLFSVISDLAKVIQKKTPPDQLMPFLESLYDGLLDNQAQSASGSCVILNSIIQTRGAELHSQAEKITEALTKRLVDMKAAKTRTGTLRALRTLAAHHLLPVTGYFLQQPLPLERHMEECWEVLGHDHVLTVSLLDNLLETLARVVPYEEKPDPRVKDGTMRVSSLQPMTITSALGQLCQSDEVQSTILEHYPRLLSATMIRISSTVGTKPPKVTREELRDKKTVTTTKEVSLDPCISAIHSCQQVIRASMVEEFITGLSTSGVWNKLTSEEEYDEGFTLFARSMIRHTPQHVPKLISYLTPALGSVYPPQRVMAAAVFSEFISHQCAGDLDQVEMLTNSFLGRLVDTEHKVRMLCVRGLGNVASAGPDQVQKYSTTVLSAMMSGMDDKDDIEDDITLEAMEGLSKILKQIDENHIRAILINIALRIRPCFEKEKSAVRTAAITLFGNLSRFGGGPSKEPFLEQIHTNLVSLLLHLNDPDTEVRKACKGSLRQLGPLLGSDSANTMFQTHLLGEGSLLYGEFINDLTKILLLDFPDKANFYLMASVNFFKSSWPEIKGNSAMFTGFLLGNMSKEMYVGISREHVCNALVLLLKEESPEVRIKAAEAMSWLHDL